MCTILTAEIMAEFGTKLETKRILIMVLGFCTGFALWIVFIIISQDTIESDLKILRNTLRVSISVF